MSRASVLVLGCGPAGLLATHAARLNDCKVTIISQKKPSFISGAQFLHTAIPALTQDEPDGELTFVKQGSSDGYASKIYGDPLAPTSWDLYEAGVHGVWHLQKWYQYLWDLYEYLIQDGLWMAGLLPNAATEFDAILSTIPIKAVFPDARLFTENVRILEEDLAAPQTIVYSGRHQDPWYRASNIFGHYFVEYPAGPSFSLGKDIQKPLRAEYTNPHENVHLLGRYGKWQKGVLVDDAFREACKITSAL